VVGECHRIKNWSNTFYNNSGSDEGILSDIILADDTKDVSAESMNKWTGGLERLCRQC